MSYCPAPHGAHAPICVVGAIVFGAQAVHFSPVPPLENVPAAQGMHCGSTKLAKCAGTDVDAASVRVWDLVLDGMQAVPTAAVSATEGLGGAGSADSAASTESRPLGASVGAARSSVDDGGAPTRADSAVREGDANGAAVAKLYFANTSYLGLRPRLTSSSVRRRC